MTSAKGERQAGRDGAAREARGRSLAGRSIRSSERRSRREGGDARDDRDDPTFGDGDEDGDAGGGVRRFTGVATSIGSGSECRTIAGRASIRDRNALSEGPNRPS